MGAEEIRQYLTHLATDGQVSASTQNQSLSALLFLYREVLNVELPFIDGIERAVNQAKAAAAGKNVGVNGADTIQQLLNAGLLDEISFVLLRRSCTKR